MKGFYRCLRAGCLCFGLIVFMNLQAGALSPAEDVDWTQPQTVDPLQPGIGDFLDIDAQTFIARGRREYQSGHLLEAASNYLTALHYNGNDAVTIYNLACCYGKLGEAELAASNLKRAINNGFSDIAQIKTDKDFDPVRENPQFKAILKQIESATSGFGDVVYIKAAKLIQCRIQLPDNFDPQREYPLLIALHGNGGNAENMIRLWQEFKAHDFIFAAPEGAYQVGPGSANRYGSYSWEIRTKDERLWRRGDPLSLAYIQEVADYLAKNFRVKGVFLLGFSQGVAYAYATAILNPQGFRGVIAFAGVLPVTDLPYSLLTEEQIAAASNIPVFIAHGTGDKAIDYDLALEAKERLENFGYDVTFKSFMDGHVIDAAVLRKAEKWMLEKIK